MSKEEGQGYKMCLVPFVILLITYQLTRQLKLLVINTKKRVVLLQIDNVLHCFQWSRRKFEKCAESDVPNRMQTKN